MKEEKERLVVKKIFESEEFQQVRQLAAYEVARTLIQTYDDATHKAVLRLYGREAGFTSASTVAETKAYFAGRIEKEGLAFIYRFLVNNPYIDLLELGKLYGAAIKKTIPPFYPGGMKKERITAET